MSSGARILVSLVGGQLQLSGDGQDAIEMVQPAARAMRARFEALNRRSQEIISEGRRGNDTPMRDALRVDLPLATIQAEQERVRGEDARLYGTFKRATVLGTSPGPEDRAFTLVRIEFDRGARFVRCVWGPKDKLMGVRGLPAPFGEPFFTAPDGGLVSYSVTTSAQTRLAVERGADGTPAALVTNGPPRLKATRKDGAATSR
jgi:hypothetical protein